MAKTTNLLLKVPELTPPRSSLKRCVKRRSGVKSSLSFQRTNSSTTWLPSVLPSSLYLSRPNSAPILTRQPVYRPMASLASQLTSLASGMLLTTGWILLVSPTSMVRPSCTKLHFAYASSSVSRKSFPATSSRHRLPAGHLRFPPLPQVSSRRCVKLGMPSIRSPSSSSRL